MDRDISITLQAFLKSVVENYPAKDAWTKADEDEIINRVAICRNVFVNQYKIVFNNQNKGAPNGNNSQN